MEEVGITEEALITAAVDIVVGAEVIMAAYTAAGVPTEARPCIAVPHTAVPLITAGCWRE